MSSGGVTRRLFDTKVLIGGAASLVAAATMMAPSSAAANGWDYTNFRVLN